MADRPLRPATDHRLGELLPHQQANQTSAALIARGLTVPRFPPQGVCGISATFAALSPTIRYVPIYYVIMGLLDLVFSEMSIKLFDIRL